MCATHQVHCPDPECNWMHLSREPCPRCSKAQVNIRKYTCTIPFLNVKKQVADRQTQKDYSKMREQEVYDSHIANKGQKKGTRR